MKVTVMRLKNAPAGQPYAIEQMSDLTPAQAGTLSLSWWESRGTLAMILLADDVEDSRYERDYMVAERVPDEWPVGKKPPVVEPSPTKAEAPARPPRPRAPPSVANPQRKQGKQAKCPTCDRLRPSVKEARREISDDSAVCPTCGQPFTCASCLRTLTISRHHDGDDDPTPSGRLANHRCPECGAAQYEMTGRAIWNQYTRRKG